RAHQVAEDVAVRAVVELDLEPVLLRRALEDLEHLAALGDVDLAVAGARAGVHRRLLRDHAQVRIRFGAATEHRADERDRWEGKSHWNQARKVFTAGTFSSAKIGPPVWSSMFASGLVRNSDASGVLQLSWIWTLL